MIALVASTVMIPFFMVASTVVLTVSVSISVSNVAASSVATTVIIA